MKSPIRPTDDDARALARDLMNAARIAALGVVHPETGLPHVTRIAIAPGPVTLISDLSLHARALRAKPDASILLGEAPDKGDPLAFPRITLAAKAQFVDRTDPDHTGLREEWLKRHPKAALYIDFADFHFVRFQVTGADLNGGFGKAYRLTPDDLA